jgi:hypothetical protein
MEDDEWIVVMRIMISLACLESVGELGNLRSNDDSARDIHSPFEQFELHLNFLREDIIIIRDEVVMLSIKPALPQESLVTSNGP